MFVLDIPGVCNGHSRCLCWTFQVFVMDIPGVCVGHPRCL